MILSVTGSYGTGSSAVADLIKEFDNVSCVDRTEIRILYDPDGISDLEYNLIENPNRHNTSHAIKRFLRMAEMLDHVFFVKRYSRDIGPRFMDYTRQYIDDITDVKYKGIWHYDIYEKGKLYYFVDSIYRHLRIILHERLNLPLGRATILPKAEMAYLGVTNEEKFLKATKNYVSKILKDLNKDEKEYVLIDQIVPTSNIQRYMRYFDDDIRVIIVERDPRDIFLLSKELWDNRVVPAEDVETFCAWYRWTRNLLKNYESNKNILIIRFEDMIYQYEQTKKKIITHYRLKDINHINKRTYFKPELTAGNTKLWEKYQKKKKDIHVIEHLLPEYCYDYTQVSDEYRVNRDKHKIF